MQEIELLNNLLESTVKLTNQLMTEVINSNFDQLDYLVEQRGKALTIINHLTEKLHMKTNLKNSKTITLYNDQLSQLIAMIEQSDEILLNYLNEESVKTQNQIAKTFKNKENLKGYNLNFIK